jgi:hypothetical protein
MKDIFATTTLPDCHCTNDPVCFSSDSFYYHPSIEFNRSAAFILKMPGCTGTLFHNILLMRLSFFPALLLIQINLPAQQILSGNVSDNRGNPLTGANVFLQGTYEGTTTDTAGFFRLETRLTGEYYLLVRYIGFRQYHQVVKLDGKKPGYYNISLTEEQTDIREVNISAGSFEAGDRKKGVVLSSYDITTTAGAMGDIAGAMNTLPGTMRVGEEGALFVRGGEKHETRTLIDGMMLERPYTSKNTDFPVRSRFSPLLFNGTLFSTGDYSAEYGQALSSVLLLTTNSSETDDLASIALHNVGAGINLVRSWKETSITSASGYSNMWPYYTLFKTDIHWDKMPSSFDQTFAVRRKTGNGGALKILGTYNFSNSSLNYPSVSDNLTNDLISLSNHNVFIKATYNDRLSDQWIIKTGWAMNFDNEKTGINKDLLQKRLEGTQAKITFLGDILPFINLKIGADYLSHSYYQDYRIAAGNSEYAWDLDAPVFSAFAESEVNVKGKLALRLGTRFENTGKPGESLLCPRLSLAAKTGKNSQLSFAYGSFCQLPEDEYLIFSPGLKMEQAQHTMLNYQYSKSGRIFRAEGYLKNYNRLVTFDSLYCYMPDDYQNDGEGYARGLDLFYRDKTSFQNGDFWISYSWIDSKRKYHEYEYRQVPGYITAHNLSVVYKQYFESLKSFAGFSYSFASGRPYHDPNYPARRILLTPCYNDLSFNFLRITRICGKFAAVHCVINNLPGFNNIFGYRFNSRTDGKGHYASIPIKPPNKRFVVVGIVLLLDDPVKL